MEARYDSHRYCFRPEYKCSERTLRNQPVSSVLRLGLRDRTARGPLSPRPCGATPSVESNCFLAPLAVYGQDHHIDQSTSLLVLANFLGALYATSD